HDALPISAERPFGGRRVGEDDRERRVDGAQKTRDRSAPEAGVLVDTGRDQRMRDLHQERSRTAEQEEALAVDAARDGVDRENAVVTHTTSVLLRSFAFAAAGVAYIVRTQRNARIELGLAVL